MSKKIQVVKEEKTGEVVTQPEEQPAEKENYREFVTYQLKVPIKDKDGVLVTEIILRRLKGKQMRAIPSPTATSNFLDYALGAAVFMSGLPE